jgi:predicted RecA/RadA family phage recombinase
MQNFRYSGQSLTFTAIEPLISGQPYLLGSAFGIVSNSLAVGQSGELFLTGGWTLPKDASDLKVGDKLYWDSSNKLLTGKSQPDSAASAPSTTPPPPFKLVGMCAEDALAAKTTVLCRLNGVTL